MSFNLEHRKAPRPTRTIELDEPPAIVPTGRKWPTKREQAATRRKFNAALARWNERDRTLFAQCQANGRCDGGPNHVHAEQWAWTPTEERLIGESVVAVCAHGNMGGACQHFGKPCWGNCGLETASTRQALPPWARDETLSDEEWEANLNRWGDEFNEREARATAKAAATADATDASEATGVDGDAGA